MAKLPHGYPFHHSQYKLTDFELDLINFVKDHKILYDKTEVKKNPPKGYIGLLWRTFAAKWNYDPIACQGRWKYIMSRYITFMTKGAPTYSYKYDKYSPKYMSFLNPLIRRHFESNKGERLSSPKRSENIDAIELHKQNEILTIKNFSNKSTEVGPNSTVLREGVCMEFEKDFTTENTDPQPSTSGMQPDRNKFSNIITIDDSTSDDEANDDGCKVEVIDEDDIKIEEHKLEDETLEEYIPTLISDPSTDIPTLTLKHLKDDIKTEENKFEKRKLEDEMLGENIVTLIVDPATGIPSLTVEHLEMSTPAFFKELGKYVTNRFPEKKQKTIFLKGWDIIINMKLKMICEEDA